jgi:leucine efflux protein
MQGVAAGYRAAVGVFVGDMILMLLASAGAASVLYTNPTLFLVLKYAGAAYLTWIGIDLVRQAWHGWRHNGNQSPAAPQSTIDGPREAALDTMTSDHTANRPRPKSPTRSNTPKLKPAFRGALLISLLNPKAIFFFISFFVQFVDPNYAYPVLTFLLLGVIVQVFSVSYLAALIHGGAHLAKRMGQHPRLNALGAVMVGGIFIWFGVKLAQASL